MDSNTGTVLVIAVISVACMLSSLGKSWALRGKYKYNYQSNKKIEGDKNHE